MCLASQDNISISSGISRDTVKHVSYLKRVVDGHYLCLFRTLVRVYALRTKMREHKRIRRGNTFLTA
jgi:hypothetical protein